MNTQPFQGRPDDDQYSGGRSAAPTALSTPHERILELDGFRAIAVLMVMFGHMHDGWPLPQAVDDWIPRILYTALTHGWLGVDLFFILSGFLITGILIDERERPHYFSNFYGRRALRILPLAICCIVAWYVTYGHPYGRFFLLALLFCANLNVLFRFPEPHGPGVLWSLAVEEHFYLLWPVAVRFLRRRALMVICVGIILVSPMLRAWGVASGMRADGEVYELSWFRFDGLALGALLAIWARSRYFTVRNTWIVTALWLGLILIATVVTLPYGVSQAKSPAAAALRYPQAQALFAAAMALSLVHQGSPLTAPLRSGAARVTAKLSYCLYLIHLSLGDLYYWTLGKLTVNDVASFGPRGALLVRTIVIIGASFALAAASQRYLEAPFMRLRKHFA